MNLQLFAGEKTEPATPKRREDARKKGQVAKSGEIGIAIMVLAGFMCLRLLGPFMWSQLKITMAQFLMRSGEWEGTTSSLQEIFIYALFQGFKIVGPIFVILLVFAFVGQAAQVGLRMTPESLMPKFSRINPIEGLKRIFSKRAIVEFLKSILKISVIGYFVYRQLKASTNWLPGLGFADLEDSLQLITNSIVDMAIWVGVILLVVAAADYFYQRWEFEQSIKMSKQEIKEELKQVEGDPLIRSKIRQKQRQMATSRMMQSIPSADVIVTNPTHYAVAISYKADEMQAPQVVAKGVDAIAMKIREIAQENNVAIMEKPELARTLYKTTEIGQEIPADLYPAVAEVLAFVYRLRNRVSASEGRM